MTTKDKILLCMLVFVPISFITEWLHLHPVIVFLTSGLAIIPLAAWIANSTEEIATVVGPSLGGLLNATFGNATEMIISIVALRAGLVEVVKASITGTIVANLLLALGAAIFLGGLRFKEQSFQPTVARINASSLNLALVVLLTPTAIDFTSKGLQPTTINNFSAVAAILLLVFYLLMLLFSMKTHRDMYELRATELDEAKQAEIKSHQHQTSLWKNVAILLICTIALVFVSDVLVASLQKAISTLGFTSLFTGVILIPLFGGAVEYITAATFAMKNKMDLAVAVAMGSSLQIAMFVAPILVLVGQFMGEPMNLDFNPFEVLAVAIAVFITNSISTDGNSNWLEGALLLITYAVLGAAFYFHP
ncbi:calcium/proton antiporter, CaCA family protein [Nostoc commune NIES-4072]|uniref:Ca(2+)/H(+) antiporter n=1 Tax=Nostoc commune NIES-4072 TaxID=2005467 RepID=A0A2R5FLG6_NOSCO|nr:calcium/proton exchanger [Nostoc commune]BBD63820.1 calcium/proton antiporter, CaCA family protein [Nostoc commune HK-02]GBG18859.1 calcium/proton antiporter, CaCA family protein [Nostoc commune NIES-4072]